MARKKNRPRCKLLNRAFCGLLVGPVSFHVFFVLLAFFCGNIIAIKRTSSDSSTSRVEWKAKWPVTDPPLV